MASKRMTPMEIFQRQLLSLYRWQRQTPNEPSLEEDDVLVDNTKNFIPTNEIGLGAVLLKADPGSSLSCSSSTDDLAQPQSSTNEP
ncbi:unnamed protein product [Sphenostylis stenocarpa]|uniref:Uncharacterized protein n=1 Tax=Sphenostylis stenocarpa TaxID=92480 RepID=A0AA86SP53_9FABA|nr:unnamed protein product [Sphenostylis stenocarpa]